MENTINLSTVQKSNLVQFQDFFTFFNFISSNNKRTKSPVTLIFINIQNIPQKNNSNGTDYKLEYDYMNQFLSETLRESDILTKLPDFNGWIVLLPNAEELEGVYYLRRLNKIREEFSIIKGIKWCASIVEIKNTLATFEEIYTDGIQALKEALMEESFSFKVVEKYQTPEPADLKVSIIENDQITNNIFCEMMKKIDVENFELNIRSFFDGQSFLDSSWYQSDHMHLILMNYALPKKNGMQLLHELRSMPNNRKYIIYIIAKQQAPEDLIYAYESGVDGFIIKPFNLSVVRAELKQMIKRIRI
ncbi:response regulator [Rummeliibacillus sp. NPDC094406]|uniref:response regulator n=1 Tax=Rummeliibacillus sp. NPDC094406 TaxID=3364511 RepID=UPI0037FE6E68